MERKNPRFNEAYVYHFGVVDRQDFVKAMHGYDMALMVGCPEGGVNAIHMICKSIAAAEEENPEAPKVLQDKL